MRQSKHEYFGSRPDQKTVIVVNYYVPSPKRFKDMTPEDREEAKKWLQSCIDNLKVIMETEYEPTPNQ